MTRWFAGVARGVGPLRQLGLALAITVAVFFLIRVVPGDVVDVLGLQGDLTEDQKAAMRDALGLDRGLVVQFKIWLQHALSGDLGQSLRFDRPVSEMVWIAMPVTLKLAGGSLAIGLLVGVGLAVLAVLYPRSPFPTLVDAVNVWSIAVPTFCIGVAAILVFSVWLKWLPVLGQTMMPALIIGLDIAGTIVKPLYEDLKEGAAAGFIRTARAKGLSPTRIVLRHLLPNSATVVIALAGIVLAGLIGGTITVEVLFGLPGLGTLALDSINGRDYPLVQAVILILALSVVVVNMATDAAQRLIDPRLR